MKIDFRGNTSQESQGTKEEQKMSLEKPGNPAKKAKNSEPYKWRVKTLR